MADNNSKKQLLDFMDSVESDISSFVKGLSSDEKNKTGSLEEWSAKDVFSHLVFWGNHFNAQFDAAKKGEKVPEEGSYGDEVNDGVLFQHLNQPFEDALSEYRTSFKRSVKIITEISQEDLTSKELYDYLKNRTLIDRALGTFGWHIVFHISDYYLKAGQKEKAIALQEKYTLQLRAFPDWEANAIYNLACFYAQLGDFKKVFSNLKPAFLLRPDLIDWAKQDGDLDPVREEAEFKTLLAEN